VFGFWSAARHRKLCLGVFSVPPEGVKNREQFLLRKSES